MLENGSEHSIKYNVSIFDMIDVHCHLEQEDYNADRDLVIAECKKSMKFLITSCAHYNDLDLTLEVARKNKGFVFCCLGLHPEYIKDLDGEKKKEYIKQIEKHKKEISGIGEIGLDYYWIKESEWQEKQKEMFTEFLNLAKKLNLPVIVHSRDAMQDTIDILEKQGMKGKKVLMHLFGEKEMLTRVIDNGWSISIGPLILKNKETRKIARDCPIEKIMLETDSPWFGDGKRGTPLNVIKVCEKIAEIKKISKEEVERQTDLNAKEFFGIK
jgi:TatD DNase family protein